MRSRQMKKKIAFITFLFVGCFPLFSFGQVSTYQATQRIKGKTFNFYPDSKAPSRLRNNHDARIVFSDRNSNKAFSTAYGQHPLGEYKVGEAFYVIGEKNGFYQLVKADPKLLGRPKGLFGWLYSPKNHFSDKAKVSYVGWMPKNNLLYYDHAYVSPTNNRAVRYSVGVNRIERLYNLRRYLNGDSLILFSDPFLKTPCPYKIHTEQSVYAYKRDDVHKTVLISDCPQLSTDSTHFMGWVSMDMITAVGQNEVYRIMPDAQHLACTSIIGNDTMSVHSADFQSRYLFDAGSLSLQSSSSRNVSFDSLHSVWLPVSVWDGKANKFINVKGGYTYVSDVQRMKNGQKQMNIHVFFFAQDKHEVGKLISALQNVALRMSPNQKYAFSATMISELGNQYLPLTDSLVQWLDFIQSPPHVTRNKDAGVKDAFRNLVLQTRNDCFEDNLLFLFGKSQDISIDSHLHQQLASRSFSMTFFQLSSDNREASQDFLLTAKEALDKNIAEYSQYIQNYIVDPFLLKPSLFFDYGTDANVYLLETPKSSLATGGIVFPLAGQKISNATVELVLDTLFSQIPRRDELLLSSLERYENRLGVLRSKPSWLIRYVHQYAETPTPSIDNIDRNSVSDVYYIPALMPDSTLSHFQKGYVFSKNEISGFLQSFRDLFPVFSEGLGKRELKLLRSLYRQERKNINKRNLRKVLSSESSLAELFYHKTGVHVNDSLFYHLSPSRLKRNEAAFKDWEILYDLSLRKLQKMEEDYVEAKLEEVLVGNDVYYFIPQTLIP